MLALLLLFSQAQPAETRLACVADTNMSSHVSEVDLNFGASPRIRLKGIEMMMLAKFDASAIRGWRVQSAEIRLHAAGPHRLRTMGVSTVAVDWVEGTGTGTRVPGGSTFTWAEFGKRRWAGRQSDFTDVALTEMGTQVHYTDLKPLDDGWFAISVPPDLVHALADGRTFGFAITDEKGQTYANNDVHAREQSGFAPYMLVRGTPSGRVPAPPRVPRTAAPVRRTPPPLAAVPREAPQGAEPKPIGGRYRVWAYGDCEKAHPVSGNLLEEVGMENLAGKPAGSYRAANAVWNGGTGTVRLAAASNEFAAFHLCIENLSQEPLRLALQARDLRGPSGAVLPARNIAIYQAWYVKDGEPLPELAIPLRGGLQIPDPRQGIAGQRNQSLLVEAYVPHGTPAGIYKGALEIAPEGAPRLTVPLEIRVRAFELPDELGFRVDLNAYGPPGDAAAERAFHRMAHVHRATLNILGYSQAGQANPDYVPRLEGEGADTRIVDWSAFDRRFGPYFDGSAFQDLPRRGVPLANAYLPLHEGWPADIRKHYRYTPTTTAYPEIVAEHALRAPPIEQAFTPAYAEAFQAVARQFAQHLRDKGWDRTDFQFYLNNKYYFRDPAQGGRGSSWWLLDEPMHRDDWLALRYFGTLFKEATRPVQREGLPRLVFRADVSRPQWQRDWLDGLVDLMCVSGELFRKNQRCLAMQERLGCRFWHYGEANAVQTSNLNGAAWAVKAYLAGADAIVPWNSLGGEEAYSRPTPTALLVPGTRVGVDEPVASLRLKALRRGQQDVEYLAIFAARRGWSRAELASAVGSLFDLQTRVLESFVDDAGRTVFDNITSEKLARLRESVAAEIEKGSGGSTP